MYILPMLASSSVHVPMNHTQPPPSGCFNREDEEAKNRHMYITDPHVVPYLRWKNKRVVDIPASTDCQHWELWPMPCAAFIFQSSPSKASMIASIMRDWLTASACWLPISSLQCGGFETWQHWGGSCFGDMDVVVALGRAASIFLTVSSLKVVPIKQIVGDRKSVV